jgi:hypothetical protein
LWIGAGGQAHARIDGAHGDRDFARQAASLHLQELFDGALDDGHILASRLAAAPVLNVAASSAVTSKRDFMASVSPSILPS